MRMRRLLVIGWESIYGHRVMDGIHAYCRRRGRWEYHIEESTRGSETIARSRFAIREWKADGIIAQVQTSAVEKMILDSGLPAVSFSGSFPARLPTVIVDSAAVGRMIARHFLDNGCRNFGFCAYTNEPSSQRRCAAFVDEVSKAGFTCDVFTDHFSGMKEKDWYGNRRRMDQWLRRLPKPVAIMCIHDPRGQEISWACRRLSLRIPDDVALVAVGNDEILCGICNPPLSSVDTDAERIGYEAARLLDKIMRGQNIPDKPVLIRPRRVVPRQSSDIVAVEDSDVAAAVRYIRDHSHEPIAVKDVIGQVHISRRSLERRFEQSIGRSPKAEIIRLRMERAKTLLMETDFPISAIAVESGFVSQEKFSAAFRRECGITATAYRRSGRVELHATRAIPTLQKRRRRRL